MTALGSAVFQFKPPLVPARRQMPFTRGQLGKNALPILPNIAPSIPVVLMNNVVALWTERDERR
jgi:hypothetical protein